MLFPLASKADVMVSNGDVRFGSKADIGAPIAMSAIPAIADKLRGGWFVRVVPKDGVIGRPAC